MHKFLVAYLSIHLVAISSIPFVASAEKFGPQNCEDLFSTDLVTEMTHEIDHRVEGLSATDATMKVFSTRGSDTNPWARSTTTWTTLGDENLNLTGASPWNSTGYTKGGVLITPRHIVFANHFPIATGSLLAFVDADNNVATRTLVAQMEVRENFDMQIGLLDSDVPETIAFYPVITNTQTDKYFSTPYIPILVFDQEEKAHIYDVQYWIGGGANHHSELSFFTPPATTTRSEFAEGLVGGDSGKPGFFLVDNQPILALTVTSSGHGPSYGAHLSLLNDAILALGNDGGHQVSTYDLSCFVGNEVPVVESETFFLSELSEYRDVVGTTTATDANASSTLTYEIIEGNDEGVFSIASSTGVIRVLDETGLDYETDPSYSLTVQVTDDWYTPATSTGIITINLIDENEWGGN